MKTWKVTVELTTEDDADSPDVAEYVSDAVSAHCGALRPPSTENDGDPMWGVENVNVVSVVKKRAAR